MRKDTIVFLSCVPLTTPTAGYLNIPKFLEHDYRVFYLDLSEYYFPKTHTKYASTNKNFLISDDYIVKCANKKEILRWIKNEAHRAWFCMEHRNFNFQIDDIWLLYMLRKYQCDYFVMNHSPVFNHSDIMINNDVSVVKYIIKKMSLGFLNSQFKSLPQKTVSYCVRKGILLQNPRFFFIAGKSGEKKAGLLFPKTEVISVPSHDYDRARKVILKLKNNPQNSVYPENYIVYLDQGVFNSPDAGVLGYTTIDKSIFFKKINNFFDRLETVTAKKIVIAASSKYSYKGDEYNARKIIYNDTPTATYYSDMAIAHSTTAINYAIIMKKPLLLLMFKEFSDYTKESMSSWLYVFGKKPIDSEEEFDREKIEDMTMVKPEVYESYLKNYIISECSDKSATEIMIEKLRNHSFIEE